MSKFARIHNSSAIIMMLISTMIWGAGFVFVKWLKPYCNPFESNHWRIFLAFAIFLPYIIYCRGRIKQAVLPAFVAAIFLYGMLTFQTWGLYHTSVAKSGFLTTLYVVIVPLILFSIERRKFSKIFYFACLLSLLGVFLLNDANFSSWNLGDSLTVVCAVFASIHIIIIEKVQPKIISPILFNAHQTMFLALFAILFSWTHQPAWWLAPFNFDALAWIGLIGVGFLSSVVAFSFQIQAQKKIPSHLAGILFLLESPFAAIAGYWWLSEPLTFLAIAGCSFIIVASILILKQIK